MKTFPRGVRFLSHYSATSIGVFICLFKFMPISDVYSKDNFPDRQQLVYTALKLMSLDGLVQPSQNEDNCALFEGQRYEPYLEDAFSLWKKADYLLRSKEAHLNSELLAYCEAFGKNSIDEVHNWPEGKNLMSYSGFRENHRSRKNNEVFDRAFMSFFFFRVPHGLMNLWMCKTDTYRNPLVNSNDYNQVQVFPKEDASELKQRVEAFIEDNELEDIELEDNKLENNKLENNKIPVQLKYLVNVYVYHQSRCGLEPSAEHVEKLFSKEQYEFSYKMLNQFKDSGIDEKSYEELFYPSFYFWVQYDAKIAKIMGL